MYCKGAPLGSLMKISPLDAVYSKSSMSRVRGLELSVRKQREEALRPFRRRQSAQNRLGPEPG
jgi:uncharacterized membrane protein